MGLPKRFRFILIPAASLLMTAGLILPATSSDAAVTVYQIQNGELTCLGANSSSQSETVSCNNGGAGSQWHINAHISLNGKTYNQWENNNNKCLGLAGGTGPQLVTGACSSTSDHSQFWWGPGINNLTQMKNGHTGLCAQGTAINGILIKEFTCSSITEQLWEAF